MIYVFLFTPKNKCWQTTSFTLPYLQSEGFQNKPVISQGLCENNRVVYIISLGLPHLKFQL